MIKNDGEKGKLDENSIVRASKLIQNKFKKKKNLYDAALELFLTKGIQDTVIDDIVKKAGVAKGTFYLYFKDKYDIIDKIILEKSFLLIEEAVNQTEEKKKELNLDSEDSMVFFIEYIIEYFKNNKKLLKLIYKNLSWGIFRRVLDSSDHYQDIKNILQLFIHNMQSYETDILDIEKKIYIVIELTSSVIYSAIILEDPFSIDEIKPVLLDSIKRILI